MPNQFKRTLKEGKQQIGIWSSIPSPFVTELLAGSGYDWILLDTEHAPAGVPQMIEQLRAADAARPGAGGRTSAVVRPAWNDAVLIKQYLDIGAQTLLLPFVQNAEEAHYAIAATRYPPLGTRGVSGAMRASNFGRNASYLHCAHEDTCLLVQVETREALAEIEGIARLDGIDGIFIGPSDLSASMGHPGDSKHPEVDAAICDAIVRIRACGKAPGILMADAARASKYLQLGAQFVAVAMDVGALRMSIEHSLRQFR
ncbi:2-dehydro-3-deoxyglucarate aldolase [Caballeronia glebae]|uniref:2-dehydro-3-deoxyglucarate aldolase n=1 Tax=Caballeronia glebae TaxID=1777143 RepID=A0A158A408_9BURK|nr:HpcH/HpaI aldolase/citrate lyase family protein [Caballeronia glebae]SAK52475.1 2-dehydro-3-deoxyglucarate aldolase [Caballeronia glebae]